MISLRGFARDDSADELRAVSVEKIITDSIELARPRIKDARVRLQTNGVTENLFVCGRCAQLTQVLLNLIGNSVYAIEVPQERWIKISAEKRDGSCVLRIQDSGNGIPDDVRPKVMQAFFTTKPPGKGTGLGLSISKTIIDSHGGKLQILPDQPHTTFEIELPTFEAASDKPEGSAFKAS